MQNWHEIDFRVPLSNSALFDMNTRIVAEKLTAKFPGLQWEQMEENDAYYIHIFGELNDFWFNEYNKAVFQLGVLED